jgi:hypothetical protein
MTEQNVRGGEAKRSVAERSSLACGGAQSAAESVAESGSVAECYRSASCGAPRGGMKRSLGRWRKRGVVERSRTQWRSVAWRHEAQRGVAAAAAVAA